MATKLPRSIWKRNLVFEGARIVVTSFATANKEFNLTFENLTQQAKAVLDANLYALQRHLREGGFVSAIHIITTSTTETVAAESPQAFTSDQEGQQGGGEGQPQEEAEEG